MNPMKEIIDAAKRGDFEVQKDGRVFVFTNKEIREGYMLEKDEFNIGLKVKAEYQPSAGNRYAGTIVRWQND